MRSPEARALNNPLVKNAKAFSPAGISSFFEICDVNEDGTPLNDPERIGARGGGFALAKGVTSVVKAKESEKTGIEVFINNTLAPEAETTRTMVKMLLGATKKEYFVEVRHDIEVPIGSGFGTSAAGAFSCGLALNHALGLNLTYNAVARTAHVADVVCRTGLGTVEAMTVGGLVLVVKSGAVGIGLVDRIPVPPTLMVVAGTFRPINKSEILLSPEKKVLINKLAQQAMDKIIARLGPQNFLKCCQEFAVQSGLASERVKQLMKETESAGAIGAAQNMIGEAVHAVTYPENLDSVYQIFLKHLKRESITVSRINFEGARLLP